MKAIRVAAFGGPEVLVPTEVPDPHVAPGQVAIDVAVADTLFLDTQLRGGWGREYFAIHPPYVPGTGVAGQVVSAGERVGSDWLGRRVIASTGQTDGYAERAVASADELIQVPDGLGLREAAALLHDGNAAQAIARVGRIRLGDRVLVLAAGGGLGILLVQLAHAAGARVVGAASGRRKRDLALEFGADAVVDYAEPGWADRARAAAGGAVDLVLDGVGGQVGGAAFEVTAAGGRFIAYGAPSGGFAEVDPQEAERRGVTLLGLDDVRFAPADERRLIEEALAAAVAGRLRPVIGQTFPLHRAADAHAAIEAREVVGKTLLLTGKGTT